MIQTVLESFSYQQVQQNNLTLFWIQSKVVSFIYNLCYCLSQTCNPLQMDHALHLRSNLINQEGIETEHIMGYTCSKRTLNNVMHKMSQSHLKSFEDFITTANCKWLVVYDFKAIHTKRRPEEEKLSEAKTVCTIVVEVFKDIQAVPVMHALFIHDQNGIDIESCIQLSTAALSMHGISESYASLINPGIKRHRMNQHSSILWQWKCTNDVQNGWFAPIRSCRTETEVKGGLWYCLWCGNAH